MTNFKDNYLDIPFQFHLVIFIFIVAGNSVIGQLSSCRYKLFAICSGTIVVALIILFITLVVAGQLATGPLIDGSRIDTDEQETANPVPLPQGKFNNNLQCFMYLRYSAEHTFHIGHRPVYIGYSLGVATNGLDVDQGVYYNEVLVPIYFGNLDIRSAWPCHSLILCLRHRTSFTQHKLLSIASQLTAE